MRFPEGEPVGNIQEVVRARDEADVFYARVDGDTERVGAGNEFGVCGVAAAEVEGYEAEEAEESIDGPDADASPDVGFVGV